VRTRKLEIHCPECASKDVFYSCTPGCCFNHVCSDCGTTFETLTAAKGGTATGMLPPDPMPEVADPTAECVRCNSILVFQMEDGTLVCTNCGTLLSLELTEICPA